ncbi:MAG: sulfatase-like hydrolase/transferase [Melioribacteraceae bacterium]|nr:sulfatase-like hydrolase/transferase [Melioribacteraceae bacterium]
MLKNYSSRIAFFILLFSNSLLFSQEKKNVLFIAVDDLKPMLGCYGDTVAISPNIDRLASEGTTFTNAQCQQAVCGPSRASLLTGLRPDRTRIWDLKTLIRDENPHILTLPQHFKENGYETVARGKIFDFRSVDSGNDEISWTRQFEKEPSPNQYLVNSERTSTEASDVDEMQYNDAQIATQGIEQLEQLANKDKPFFVAVGFKKPHLPFVAPQKYWDLYDRNKIEVEPFQEFSKDGPEFAYQPGWELRNNYVDIPSEGLVPIDKQKELIHGYYACVSHIDNQVGRLLNKLDELGVRENTVVILWGDHGWHLGDHAMWCKHSNFEQAARSPMVISANGYSTNNFNSSPTEFVDIFPTLCDLAGIEIPENLHGKSLSPIMDGSQNSVKDYAVTQYKRTASGHGRVEGYSLRTEQFRYTEWIPINYKYGFEPYDREKVVARELYDYKNDPLETINAADLPEYSSEVELLQNYIKEFLEGQEFSSPIDTTRENLIKNPGFESGLLGWEALKCDVSVKFGNSYEGLMELNVANRTENYAGPQQDILSILKERGQGNYSAEGAFKSFSGDDIAVKIMAKITSNGITNFFTFAQDTCGSEYKKITGEIKLSWQGELEKAFIVFPGVNHKESYYLDQCLFSTGLTTSLEEDKTIIKSYDINLTNWPNPFNPSTNISYVLPEASKVRLAIYNSIGQLVKVIVNEEANKGENLTVWNGKDQNNREVSSGIYYATLETHFTKISRKLVLLR